MLYRFDGRQPSIAPDSYVSETATLIGDVVVGPNCYIDLAAKYLAQGMTPVG